MSEESSATANEMITSIGDPVDPSERTETMCRNLAVLEEAQKTHERLKKEHEHFILEQKIKCNAEIVWNHYLSWRKQREKTSILAALRSERVPDTLKWKNFDNFFPRRLQYDRDIFLARLELEDFEETYLYDDFVVPPCFRTDKEIMLKICAKNSQALRWASKELQNDYEVVLEAVTQRCHFAPLALEYASPKLKGNKKLARAVLSRGHGIRAFKYLSDRLQEDYNLAILAIECTSEDYCREFEHLRELPDEMLEDNELVLAAVAKRGSNLRFVKETSILEDPEIILAACENDGLALQYVSKNIDFLSRNVNIVRAACMNNGSAFKFCPKTIRAELMKDSDFIMTALATADYCGDVFRRLSPANRSNPTYVLTAVENGLELKSPFLTKTYKENRSFFTSILRRSTRPFLLYKNLPKEMTTADPKIGLTVLCNKSVVAENYLAKSLVENVPATLLRKSVFQLLRAVISEDPKKFPEEVRSNKKLVVAICKADSSFYKLLDEHLRSDLDVIKATLSNGNVGMETVLNIPKDIAQQNPNVVALAIDACPHRDSADFSILTVSRFLSHFGFEIFNHKAAFLAYMRKQWPTCYINHSRTEGLRQLCDKYDVLLEAIKYCDGQHRIIGDIYYYFGASSYDDKEFMKKAVQVHPAVFGFSASLNKFDDFDYMVTAISSSRMVLFYLSHDDSTLTKLFQFAKQVRSTLSIIDGFYLFLCGISIVKEPPSKRSRRGAKKQPATSCHLPMLDFGLETGVAVKRRIAEYAGVPLGPNSKLLQPALENLKYWGY